MKTSQKSVALLLVALMIALNATTAFAQIASSNKNVFKTDFTFECTAIAPSVAWYWGDYSKVTSTRDSYDNSGYALECKSDGTYAFTGIYFSDCEAKTCYAGNLQPGKNYMLSAMMKTLPYKDSENNEYQVSLRPQLNFTLPNYDYSVFSKEIPSDGQYHKVLIPFSTKSEYTRDKYSFTYYVKTATVNLKDGSTVNNVGNFLLDELELFEVNKPVVATSSILNGANDVSVDTKGIAIEFNNIMNDELALNIENYSITGNKIKSATKNGEKTYYIEFANRFNELTDYTFSIKNLKDELNQICDNTDILFTTKEENLPGIKSVTPSNGSTNVAVDEKMVITFDTNMELSTLTKVNVTVNGTDKHIDSIAVDINDPTTATINFKNLEYLTQYKVKLSGMKNIYNKIMPDTTISFVTQAQEEIVYKNNFNAAADLSWPYLQVVNVTQTIAQTDYVSAPSAMNVTPKGFGSEIYLCDANYLNIKLEVGESYTMSFYAKPKTLTNSGIYVVTGDNAAFVFDINLFNSEMTKYTKTFTATSKSLPFFRTRSSDEFVIDDVKIVKLAKTVVLPNSTIPEDCGVNVPVNDDFTMIFNNDIKTEDITGNNIKISDTPVLIKSTTSNSVTFAPSSPLLYDTIYTLSVALKDVYNRDVTLSRQFTTVHVFETNGMKFYTNYTEAEKEDITNSSLVSGIITAAVDKFKNNSAADASANLVIALYKDTKMINANAVKANLVAGAELEAPLNVSITVPSNLTDGKYTMSAFLWNGFDNIVPILKNIEITE